MIVFTGQQRREKGVQRNEKKNSDDVLKNSNLLIQVDKSVNYLILLFAYKIHEDLITRYLKRVVDSFSCMRKGVKTPG